MSARIILLTSILATSINQRPEPPTEVKLAIDKGIHALRQAQYDDGSWGEFGPGSTALVMTALMEAGVPLTDPAIVKAAKYVRHESLRTQHTYSVACSIIALDRLSDNSDWPLVRLLTQRLIAGQLTDGGWSYACPLGELGELEKTIPPAEGNSGAPARRDATYNAASMKGNPGDNSNSQFAILALWVGHRYDIDVEAQLRKAGTRYRRSALTPSPGSIGWGYMSSDAQATPTPSCCGLLGLALHQGIAVQRRLKNAPDGKPGEAKLYAPPVEPLKDQMVQDAFRYITAQFINETKKAPEPGAPCNFCFFWSFERCAVAYGLDKTFGTDWYQLGARRIVPLQGANGMWTGTYGYEPETSFCLLFLCRSNLTRDLVSLLNPSKSAELRTDGTPPPPPPQPELSTQQLVKEFTEAPAAKREQLVVDYRDKKGVNYTDALAKLIPKLDGIWPKTLRDALATRLSRMTTDTLRERLKDTDAELRRAAAVAAAMKDDKKMIPNLIAALDDHEPWVVRAAGVALSRLTGQDFGPPPNATPEQRAKAIAAWKEWWSIQAK